MIAVFKKWPQLRGQNPRAYARKVAERQYWRSAVKERQERQKFLESDWGRPRPYLMDDALLQRDTQFTLWALGELPVEQRRVFAWAMDGFKAKEIAEELDKTEDTVRSTLRHARQKLAAIVGPRPKNTSSAGRRPHDDRKEH